MPSDSSKRRKLSKKLRRLIKKSYVEFALPLLQRPKALQTAALCYRKENQELLVLLITSRETKRWVIPKGGLMRNMNASQAAVVEAWEEAGVRPGHIAKRPIGTFVYDKIKASGLPVAVEALVYPIEVKSLAAQFPEVEERERVWVHPDKAAEMVAEPSLKRLLVEFGNTFPA